MDTSPDVPDRPPGSALEPVLTLSAAYGSGGSVLGPRLAERLGLPFVDRLLTVDVADTAARQSAEGVCEAEKTAMPGNRLFTYLARAAAVGTIATPVTLVDTDEELREHAERDMGGVASGRGAVILGRAAAVVLADRPRAFHVRLDGPASRRIAGAALVDGTSTEVARTAQEETDRARELWVKRLYRADATDTRWYHLWLDTTVLGNDAVEEIILLTFRRFLGDA